MVKLSSYIPTLDRFLKGKKEDKKASVIGPTFKEERVAAEKDATKFENARKAQKEQYPNISTSLEDKPIHKTEVNDHELVSKNAIATIKSYVGNLVGKGGMDVSLEEFRVRESHKDVVDNSNVTDNALMSVAVKFVLPGKAKVRLARFVVSFNNKLSQKEQFKVEETFYDAQDKAYPLNSNSLNGFLQENATVENKEAPIAFYNAQVDNYEIVETPVNTEKTVARLRTAGFSIDKRFIDACYDPEQFGKRCWVAKVALGKESEFKRLASLTDDEWINRTDEQSYNSKKVDWIDRTTESNQESSYKKVDTKAGWPDRTEEKGPKGNPYNTTERMMASDASKKDKRDAAVDEALKRVAAKKDEVAAKPADDIVKDLDEIEKLIKE